MIPDQEPPAANPTPIQPGGSGAELTWPVSARIAGRFESRAGRRRSADWQDHKLAPNDLGNSIRGSKSGLALQGEWKTAGTGNRLDMIGQVSTVFGSYWLRGRYGFAAGALHIGPELVATGNREYRGSKLGAYLEWPLTRTTSVDFSLGSSSSKGKRARDDVSGTYAGASISFRF